jgi:short-subunit dehydrogenase
MEIRGQAILLTGATGGLGRAIAAAMAARGASLILSGRNAEVLEELSAELPGGEHRVLPAAPGRACSRISAPSR